MTADIVNLRRERKRRVRTAAGEAAAANRVAHGSTLADKRLGRATREAADRRLDGHRLDGDEPAPPAPRRD